MQFETAEDAKKKQEEAQDLLASVKQVNVADMEAQPLSISRELKNSEDSVLAVYSVELPQFCEDGAKSTAFKRINEEYQAEFYAYSQDCESFFNLVKGYYGDDFDTVSVKEPLFSIDFTYSITDAPDKYISIIRTYAMADDEGQTEYYSAQVFLSDNGWALELSDLFGSYYETATKAVLDGIEDWCELNGIVRDNLEELTIDDFADDFCISKDSLIFLIDPFTLATADNESHIIELPLSDFEEYIVELKKAE